MLDSRVDRNKLREVVSKTIDKKVITEEDAGFVVTLAERFRADIDRKIKQMHMLQGEITQLQTNEKIIIELLQNMVAAEERAVARREAHERLKGEGVEENDSPEED